MSFRLVHSKYSVFTQAFSYKAIALCLLGMVACVSFSWWYYFCVPLCNQAHVERSTFQSLSKQYDELAEKIKKSSLILRQKHDLDRELSIFVASGQTLQSSLDKLVENMQKAGLVCIDIKPIPEKIKTKAAYKSAVIDMQARGSFKKIYNFLLSLPTLYFCHFKKMSLSKDSRKRLCLNAELKVFLSQEAMV